MRKYIKILVAVLLICLSIQGISQVQRFPKPDFETGYQQPITSEPAARVITWEYIDIVVLILVMSLTVWFILKKRSRRGVLWLSVFSLAYFGFIREGCICSIGAIQNLSLAIVNPEYSVSIPVLAFFILPLVFTLFFGRVFCASACPLGAIQDLVIAKPVQISAWLEKVLSLFPFLYFGLAVLFAATETDYIICRFDPFVGIFRLSAEFHLIVLGISILLIGIFIGRPYCRFICPYSVLLKWFSFFSWKHLKISPSNCINCNLCSDSCPFDAIDFPNSKNKNLQNSRNRKRFLLFAALIPVWIIVLGFLFYGSHQFLAKANSTVYLAKLIVEKPEFINNTESVDIETFLSSGKTLDELVIEAKAITEKFKIGSLILGLVFGLVVGVEVMRQFVFIKKEEYSANRSNCLSCGRCMDYCPLKENLDSK